jgi:predicted AAA+ superfamily ATPase
MKPWYEVISPHPDIRAGRFDESVFAADLSDVVADRGPLEYRDAELFFRKTYPTQGLVKLLSAIASRLSGKGGGEAVIQIQTPLGGGKTHSLIALYHLFKNPQAESAAELISKVRERAGLDAIPTARVVTFVGTAADPLGKTPWGELAEQLGNYALLEEHDRKRRAPGKDLLHQLLAGAPTLLLMDEVDEYAVKAKDFHEQVIAFFQELTETVKVLPQCALVVTLPSSSPYGEEGQRALYQLQQVLGRVEAIYTPVEGEEVYEIIRRRLFEGTPDPSEVRKVADSYWEMYRRLGDDVPREVRETAYRDKLRKAYPFHPEMIDLLLERWSTYSRFHRTRGVLRFLAEVVADLYNTRQHSVPLIQPAHINLANPKIREELLKHIGNEYTGVIAADIADGNAKAQTIDREMGSEYASFRVASGLATAIFFGSFSGGERRGLGIQRLRLALLREGIPASPGRRCASPA